MSTPEMIELFAKDFDIPYDRFKYSTKGLPMVTYWRTEASNSELERYAIPVPAFIIRKYCERLAHPTNKDNTKDKLSGLEG